MEEANETTIETQTELTRELLNSVRAENCSICQNSFELGQIICALTCGHGFHAVCLREMKQQVS